jgi:hypothetical protein
MSYKTARALFTRREQCADLQDRVTRIREILPGAGTGSNKKKALASTAKYPAFAKRGKRVQAFFV